MLLVVYTTTRKRFVIFTCRYFKLSWNTTALSQSNCRNFSCGSINPTIPNIHIQILQTDLQTFPLEISWENLLKDQSIFSSMITLIILVTFSRDCVLILFGENWCWSVLRLKGLWTLTFSLNWPARPPAQSRERELLYEAGLFSQISLFVNSMDDKGFRPKLSRKAYWIIKIAGPVGQFDFWLLVSTQSPLITGWLIRKPSTLDTFTF